MEGRLEDRFLHVCVLTSAASDKAKDRGMLTLEVCAMRSATNWGVSSLRQEARKLPSLVPLWRQDHIEQQPASRESVLPFLFPNVCKC